MTLPDQEDSIAGIHQDPGVPTAMAPHWLARFAVADCDASIAQAKDLGVQILMEPMESEFGRMSVVAAPQGEILGIIGIGSSQEESA